MNALVLYIANRRLGPKRGGIRMLECGRIAAAASSRTIWSPVLGQGTSAVRGLNRFNNASSTPTPCG